MLNNYMDSNNNNSVQCCLLEGIRDKYDKIIEP